MGKRPKRKIVLFLVEGKSDREALQIAISELYELIDDSIEVFFPIIRNADTEVGGDITSSRFTNKLGKKLWVKTHNIDDAIYALFLEDFFDQEKILPKDISEVIQIVDTDGTFVAEEMIVMDPDLGKENSPFYTENEILCVAPEIIRRRNQQKSQNLEELSNRDTLRIKQRTVPYSIYYFSCNLDHFLQESANIDYYVKRSLADVFSRSYIGDVKGFITRISKDPGAVRNMNYKESWDFIKEGTNSLHRHTNLNLLLEKLVSQIEK